MIRRLAAALAVFAGAAAAAPGPLPGLTFNSTKGGSVSAPMQIVLLMTLLTLLPAAVMSITPFLRIVVVLHFLRQALGTQTTPSNQVLLGLSLFLTILVMQPVGADIYHNALEPMEKGQIGLSEAMDRGAVPLRHFLLRFAHEKEIKLFVEVSRSQPPRTPEDLDLKVLMPAYILSELKASFQIGAVLFMPFLIIDLVVASVTVSMGMMQLPPVMISAPFKILLFVVVDGWTLVVGSLLKSLYR